MSNYTPTTEEVSGAYNFWLQQCSDETVEEITEKFDCWLAEVKAQVWEEGQLALLEYMGVPLYPSNGDETRNPKQPRNPYRQEGE